MNQVCRSLRCPIKPESTEEPTSYLFRSKKQSCPNVGGTTSPEIKKGAQSDGRPFICSPDSGYRPDSGYSVHAGTQTRLFRGHSARSRSSTIVSVLFEFRFVSHFFWKGLLDLC